MQDNHSNIIFSHYKKERHNTHSFCETNLLFSQKKMPNKKISKNEEIWISNLVDLRWKWCILLLNAIRNKTHMIVNMINQDNKVDLRDFNKTYKSLTEPENDK